ncbi:MAG: ATP-binding protein [Spirochaetaceae bacterium]|nr:ATP-binding protein [Spirochaetaceae bacterium]
MRHIVFQGRKYKRVIMNISGDAPFHEILKQVNGLTIPDSPHDDEHTRYAVLELINNSIRAHRENGIKDTIKTEMNVKDEVLTISIIDKGGGFDISKLPYNISDQVDDIDTNSCKFQEYREENQYKRFGMGLLVARRLFREFDIIFYDETGSHVPYRPGGVTGTRIDMKIRWANV